jgi:hypothetical protein
MISLGVDDGEVYLGLSVVVASRGVAQEQVKGSREMPEGNRKLTPETQLAR